MKTPRVHDFDPNAKVPELTSPLDGMPTIEKPQAPHTSSPVQPFPSSQAEPAAPPQLRQQKTGLPAKMQTRKDANLQASKPVNLQTRLHANLQAGKPERIDSNLTAVLLIDVVSTYPQKNGRGTTCVRIIPKPLSA